VSIPQYGDYQFDIYFDGLEGQLPKYPVDFASLERKAAETLPSWVHSYVAGGCVGLSIVINQCGAGQFRGRNKETS
jgi:hypothetical protein